MINRLRKIRTARFVESYQDTDAGAKCKRRLSAVQFIPQSKSDWALQ
jgi:hypothetical protein